jgi:uncharacterized protein (DUF2236 family)
VTPLPDHLVGTAEFENALARLLADPDLPADPAAGFFGPGSALWQVNSEAAIFLGAGRALLLQLAHPWVAAAVAEHGKALLDPLGRFHRTFETMFTLVFGTQGQALAKARALHLRHARIAGRLPSGEAYRANQEGALRFVWASLADTALRVQEAVAARRDAYWRDNRRLAALFGLAPESLPADGAACARAWAEMLGDGRLMVTKEGYRIAAGLMAGAGRRWLAWPRWYRDLTATLLPAPLASGFGLSQGSGEQAAAARAWARARRFRAGLPTPLRLVAPRLEADARLAGRAPGPVIRTLNRLWIGRPTLAGAAD